MEAFQYPDASLDINYYINFRREEKQLIRERKKRMDRIVAKRLVYAGLQERPESIQFSRTTS